VSEIAEFRDIVVVLGAALAAAVVLGRIRLPKIAGFIVAGALLGPSGLAAVEGDEEIARLAEVGVIFLLFTIGLEFSLTELRRIGRLAALGGALQVGLTAGAVVLFASLAGLPPAKGVFLGFLVALSSTAIVLRGLAERGETDAPHGGLIVGVLLFQDLCVIPMMLVTPMLAGGGGGGALAIPLALLKAAVVVVLAMLLARRVVPQILELVAHSRQRDLFLLAVVLVTACIGWLTSLAGLSLALGAFLAGVVLADTEYGHQALADVLPLRDLFASLFFVSMGMLLDVRTLLDQPGVILGALVALLLGKALIATLAGLVMRFPLRVALLAGVALSQVGEFSFVLAGLGGRLGLLVPAEMKLFLAASVLSMLVTPFALHLGPRLAAGAARLRALDRLLGIREEALGEAPPGIEGHVLILGYGVGGELLAETLRAAEVPYAVVDMNASRIRAARARGEPAFFGDVTSAEVLHRVRVHSARQVAVLINDPQATLRTVRVVRAANAEAPIVVRARYVADIPELVKAGATSAVAQEYEASLEVIGQVLRKAALPAPVVGARLEAARDRGAAAGWGVRAQRGPAALGGLAVHTVGVHEGSWIVGRSLAESQLRSRSGATLIGLSRGDATAVHPSITEPLQAGDVLYLVGDDAQRAKALELLEKGPAAGPQPG
jgi:CPA2 family monovalent cation:H+ antiporter-2